MMSLIIANYCIYSPLWCLYSINPFKESLTRINEKIPNPVP